ncbi:MAG TPA: hypothetical protein VNR11_00355 [Xanthobacteraceae bacterium]|nr:hypothetical protein [Xanthobacteraceae bacterium]
MTELAKSIHRVMPTPVAGIHVLPDFGSNGVDGRDKPGHDGSKRHDT